MNQRLYAAAGRLSATELREDKKAFFKSVLGTLNHILVGDILWLTRFSEHPSSTEPLSCIRKLPRPKSLDAMLFDDFGALSREQEKVDQVILDWIRQLDDDDLRSCLTYTNTAGKVFTKPFASLIQHLFLHQVHHRGQVTTLLSQYGVDFGETDLIEIIGECRT